MGNIKFYLASVLLLSSISSNAQTAPQIVYELQDTSLPSRIMCVFTTSEVNTPFERVKPQVILPMTRDSGDLRISSDSVMWLRFIFANPYRLMNWCPMTNKDSTFWKQFVFEQQKPVTRWYLITENNNIRRTKLYNRFGQVLDSGGYANNRFAQRVFKPSEDYFFPLESKRIINQHTGLVVPLAMDAMACTTTTTDLNETHLTILPNPTSDWFTIRYEVMPNEILVYNSLGRLLQNVIPVPEQVQMDLSAYSTGIYFIKINDKMYKIVKN